VRQLAAEILRHLRPAAARHKDVVPALTEMLKDENKYGRSSAALALGELGLVAKAALPALIAALKDEDRRVRIAVGKALKKIKGEK
jgi:HEAT repeat protein